MGNDSKKKREPHLHSKYRPQILTGNFSSYFKYALQTTYYLAVVFPTTTNQKGITY